LILCCVLWLTNLAKGSSISESLNLPIQTLAQSLPTLHRLCEAADYALPSSFVVSVHLSRLLIARVCAGARDLKLTGVIMAFYWMRPEGSRPLRRPAQKESGETLITSMVLTDGFNGWSTAGEAFDEFVTPQTM
jgi:hypothetical protein